ncbi:MAG: glycogen debranching protein GlgX [Anaerolineae bacterium]|nr:glycogen debranching protein GlgX [Anaerolineae bacterium]
MASKPLPGRSFPLGATVYPDGVNFSVFSKNCERVELLLFDHGRYDKPARVIPFDPKRNKTFYYWHMFVPGLQSGQVYAYRVHGPMVPEVGFRFDGSKVLVDPYARGVIMDNYDRGAATRFGEDNCAVAMKSVVVDPGDYDWEGDRPLQIPYTRSIIYEMHVGGFTKHPSSGVTPELRGTYLGLIEKIPYLKELGITAVELLPVQQFDPQDKPFTAHSNYWGYTPFAFFAPHAAYASDGHPLAAVNEFREMVKALHKAGIEVILDVVYNHTAEGNENGPWISYRGFENRAYYILAPDNRYYMNYSGCGNSFNANHSIVRRLIMDSLRYWVSEMHVDGFRFDLAAVLSRDEWGNPLPSPPILWEIESDPVLAGTKIIAEAWDAGGLYQVGSFIGHRWAEWNGKFRDDVRKFIKSDSGLVSALASRILASPDLYGDAGRAINRSINFITCHDGFTLNDLVSYNQKHNDANGEDNHDGESSNNSWNSGWEGPSTDPEIERLRERQIRNFLAIMLVSQGTPMLLMGDEVRRTQMGNNNAYGQDNEISWFDWTLVEANQGLLRFTAGLIHFVQTHRFFQVESFYSTLEEDHQLAFTWHGAQLHQPDWGSNSRTLAFSLGHDHSREYLHVMINAYWEPIRFELPPLQAGERWSRIVDTSLPPPNDFCERGKHAIIDANEYIANDHTVVVLLAHSKE